MLAMLYTLSIKIILSIKLALELLISALQSLLLLAFLSQHYAALAQTSSCSHVPCFVSASCSSCSLMSGPALSSHAAL